MTEPTQKPTPADWLVTNRANWDERVPIHAAGPFYHVDEFVAGRDAIRGFESAEVGDVAGKTLLHLQCHMGMDTLSWARRGATVTGLDFSEPAVEIARSLASRIGMDTARFVAANVYDAVDALGEQTFDVVYTGLGALCWLPDIEGWARTAAALVAPGGFLYLAEFHPFSDVLAEDGRTVERDYFQQEATVWDEPGTYADLTAPTKNNVTVEWVHGIGDVVSALIGAGLRLEFLHEHDFTLFPQFSALEKESGEYRFPAGHPRMPMIYSLRATKAG